MTLTDEVRKLLDLLSEYDRHQIDFNQIIRQRGVLLSLLSTEAKGEEVRVFEDTKLGCVQVFGRRDDGEFWDSEAGFNGKAVSTLKFILSDQLFGRDRELHGEEKASWLAAHPLPGEAKAKTYRVKRAWRWGNGVIDVDCGAEHVSVYDPIKGVWLNGVHTVEHVSNNYHYAFLTGPELLAVQEQYERENPITPPTPAQVKPVRKFEWVECSRFDDGAYRTIVDCIETFIHPVEIKGDSHD